jgi:hypothetical protein
MNLTGKQMDHHYQLSYEKVSPWHLHQDWYILKLTEAEQSSTQELL